ncbi:FAD-binding oxidoreductase [Blastomonas sp. AAP53]|uniref:FAD-binding oxidoreductase n=1 Tax=Blastomonas sp. AAP53 TaxID=1248760 RepID=UPI0002F1FE9D|nr:FAD-binding oxidoreductase [Blastomonas sp. AAP53]
MGDEITGLPQALARALGAAQVLTGPDQLAFYSHDVFTQGAEALCIVRPVDIAGVQAAARLCAEARVAMVPRGGGASYSDGYLTDRPHVLFDLSALQTIDIDTANACVRVGAGVIWAALKAALDPLGLRTPFWGPFSGIAATVGGSMSQNTISHGSGAHGISAQSLIGMEVVLADGSVMNTGVSNATRHYGPDMTGLFTGDCGALGLKVAITLPLIATRPAHDTASFAFADFASYHRSVSAIAREGLDENHFSIDQALSQGQIARSEGTAARLNIARNVMRAAPNPVSGLLQLGKMALAGEAEMREAQYSCHVIVEGVDKADVASRLSRIRTLMTAEGQEIADTAAAFVRSMPFAPLFNVLGPKGERWVPLHGIFSHTAADTFHDAFTKFLDQQKAEMDRHGLWTGTMFSSIGGHGLLYEIAIYWPDAVTPYHREVLGADYLATIPSYPDNPQARAYAHRFKADLVDLMQAHGAAHFQIGRAYPYLERLDPSARALIQATKAALDPHNLMNPGVLGL